jgi:hypothetical protein
MYKNLNFTDSSIWVKTIAFPQKNLDNLEYEM